MDESEIQVYLEHHGVKGMHWGVRKDRNSSSADRSSESRALRRQSRKSLQKYMWDSVKDESFDTSISKEEYLKLSRRGQTFVEGTGFKRVSLDPENIQRGAAFVSRAPKDSLFYRAAIPAIGPQTGYVMGGKKSYDKHPAYEISLTTTKKLSAPSEKVRVDTFIQILNEPKVAVGRRGKELTGRQYLESIGYKAYFKTLSDQEYGLRFYNDFVKGQGDSTSVQAPINSAYFKKLRDAGYNAVSDDNDRLRYTKAPLILLDVNGTAKVTSVHRLTTDEINQAQRKLQIQRN